MTFVGSAKEFLLNKLRRRRRKKEKATPPRKSSPFNFSPIRLNICDSDGSCQLVRLRNSLNWHTEAEAVVLHLSEGDAGIASARRDYTGYESGGHGLRALRLLRNNEEPRFLLFATLGQLPLLSKLAIHGSNPKKPQTVRVRDLAVCLRHTTQLETLQLSNVTLVGADLQEWDTLGESMLGLRCLWQLDLFHVSLQSMEDVSSEVCLWDRMIVPCSFLPCLERLYVTADKYANVSPSALKALSEAQSLKDVMIIHFHLQAKHIMALTEINLKELTVFLEHWNAGMASAVAHYIRHQTSLETLCLSLGPNYDIESAEDTRMMDENLEKLVHALAWNTTLKQVRLAGARIADSNSSIWVPLWWNNFVLQSLIIPGLKPHVQVDLDFWIKTLNGAGRSLLRDADTLEPEIWIWLLSHQDITNDLRALFYLLSSIHPYLISVNNSHQKV